MSSGDVASPSPSDVMEGPLQKRTRWTRIWANRYFELRGELLSYWKGSKRPPANKMCKHRHCTRDIESVYENIDETNSFHIVLKDKQDIILRAKDAETQNRWLDALRGVVAENAASDFTSGAAAAVVPPPAAAVVPPPTPDHVEVVPTEAVPVAAAAAPSVALPPAYESIYPSIPSFHQPQAVASDPVVAGMPLDHAPAAGVKPTCLQCGSSKLTVKPQCPHCLANGVFVLDTPLPEVPQRKGEGSIGSWKGSGSCFACSTQTATAVFVIHCHDCKKQFTPDAVL